MRNFRNDYLKLSLVFLKKEEMEIEDINEILLSKNYYPIYGEYGIINFLKFYKKDFEKIILNEKLSKDLDKKEIIKCHKI